METYSLEIFADYFLIYVGDRDSESEISELVSDECLSQRLIFTPDKIAIVTARNVLVPLVIETSDGEPKIDNLSAWDYVVECSISLPSGVLLIMGPSDYMPDATKIFVRPGNNRLRVFYGGLNTISEDGLDGNDTYKITLWPTDVSSETIFLKSL